MDGPFSPPPASGAGPTELPAYLSNGVVGLRVREAPIQAGLTLISGYTGEHPLRRIEAAAVAPYPLAADIQVNGLWASDALHQISIIDQAYDFATAELTSRFAFRADTVSADVKVLTFCSRDAPSLVCQEVTLTLDQDCELSVRAFVDARGVEGRALRQIRETPGEEPACDGSLLWESAGGLSTCGLAYATELLGAKKIDRALPPMADLQLATTYKLQARAGVAYALRQITSLAPSATHGQPDFEATRQVARARKRGFEDIRSANQAVWQDLWKGRIRLIGAPPRWQALADAAFFYLMTSTHVASPASTSIFGLATWRDYHYYYGHVMWDIETFAVPVLSLLQPWAAESILDYRFRNLSGAASNARLRGRRGLQFPWESAPQSGQETAPMPGSASWHSDHVSLDVALAFASHAKLTGDRDFLREKAWPVLSGVSQWLTSRVTRSKRGFEIRRAMGIAERETESDNAAFTNMAAVRVLTEAVQAARQLGYSANPVWQAIADDLVLPMQDSVILSHDGFSSDEEKGCTPDPLMGVFPLAYPMPDPVRDATLKFYLRLRHDYIGSPMLSALYGVWAAYAGDRTLSAELMEEGYGKFVVGRFLQTLEYRTDVFPEQPRAGPFFANLAGFLQGLLFGFPGLTPTSDDPANWPSREVILPQGWDAIEVDRLWVHGRAYKLTAKQGDRRALLQPASD